MIALLISAILGALGLCLPSAAFRRDLAQFADETLLLKLKKRLMFMLLLPLFSERGLSVV